MQMVKVIVGNVDVAEMHSPPRIAKSVLFPEPLGPITTIRSPSPPDRLTSDSMLNEPDGVGNDFDNVSAISTSLKPQARV